MVKYIKETKLTIITYKFFLSCYLLQPRELVGQLDSDILNEVNKIDSGFLIVSN